MAAGNGKADGAGVPGTAVKRLLAALTTRPCPGGSSSTGMHGPAAAEPAHDGSTNAPDSPATPRLPWSASEMRLPYQGLRFAPITTPYLISPKAGLLQGQDEKGSLHMQGQRSPREGSFAPVMRQLDSFRSRADIR